MRTDKAATSRPRTNMNRQLYSRYKSEDYFLSPARWNWSLRSCCFSVSWNWIVALAALNYTSSPTPTLVIPPSIFTRVENFNSRESSCERGGKGRGERLHRAFRIKTFVSTRLPLTMTPFITLSWRLRLASVYASLIRPYWYLLRTREPLEIRNNLMWPWVSSIYFALYDSLCAMKIACADLFQQYLIVKYNFLQFRSKMLINIIINIIIIIIQMINV